MPSSSSPTSISERLFFRSLRFVVFSHLLACFLLVSSLAVRGQDGTANMTLSGNLVYPNGNPAVGVTVIVLIRDGVANSSEGRMLTTGGAGDWFLTKTFQCHEGLFGVEFRFKAIRDDWTIQSLGSNSGGYTCQETVLPAGTSILDTSGANNPLNIGPQSCNNVVGHPINVTNGNMYLQQSDYYLAGTVGSSVSITRTYNSMPAPDGLFGRGWRSELDERVLFTPTDSTVVAFRLPDGHASFAFTYGAGAYGNGVYTPLTSQSYRQIVLNTSTDFSFTVSFRDGSSSNYASSDGRILWKRDRNGSQTSFTYNGSNQLTGVTDAFGRTLTVTLNSNGRVSHISDSTGTAAEYEYFTSPDDNLLKTVTYPDGSKYKFEYGFSLNGRKYLTTVKNALDDVLETHLYDSQGRAYTSEIHGGKEKYTLDYANADLPTGAHTSVTDGLGRVTKYYFDKSKGKNLVTKTEGTCSCGGGSEVKLFEYDDKWNITKTTDALSTETSYAYDSDGNLSTKADVFGTESYTYNSFGEMLTYTGRMGEVWTNTYDVNGNLLTAKDPLNNVTTLDYPATGNIGLPKSVKDARNKQHDKAQVVRGFRTPGRGGGPLRQENELYLRHAWAHKDDHERFGPRHDVQLLRRHESKG